jgi:hypothetical protein
MRRRTVIMLSMGGLIVIGLFLLLNSISTPAYRTAPTMGYPTAMPTMGAVMPQGAVAQSMLTDALFYEETGAEAQQPGEPQSGGERVILQNASLTLVVDDPALKMEEAQTLASEFGGWVVSANATRVGDEARASSATITIRVPAARLDEALARLKNGVGRIESEAISGQDVTNQFIDLTSRVNNLRAAEEQLQIIMDEARRVDDVLTVYNELVRVRGEIESIQGQLNYYAEAASYASIALTLRATPVTAPVEITGWRPLETARNAFQALIDLLQGAADVVIAIVVFAGPLVLVFGLPAWLILRRRAARRPAANASA